MVNDFDVRGDITVIFLKGRQGEMLEAKIDTLDLPRVQGFPFKWFARWSAHSSCYYVAGNTRNENGKAGSVSLHRYILMPEKGMVVDHINHDELDNRRANMRVVTNAENMQNRKGPTRGNISGYRGVTWDKYSKKWTVLIRINQKLIYLGRYNDRHEAGIIAANARMEMMPYATC